MSQQSASYYTGELPQSYLPPPPPPPAPVPQQSAGYYTGTPQQSIQVKKPGTLERLKGFFSKMGGVSVAPPPRSIYTPDVALPQSRPQPSPQQLQVQVEARRAQEQIDRELGSRYVEDVGVYDIQKKQTYPLKNTWQESAQYREAEALQPEPEATELEPEEYEKVRKEQLEKFYQERQELLESPKTEKVYFKTGDIPQITMVKDRPYDITKAPQYIKDMINPQTFAYKFLPTTQILSGEKLKTKIQQPLRYKTLEEYEYAQKIFGLSQEVEKLESLKTRASRFEGFIPVKNKYGRTEMVFLSGDTGQGLKLKLAGQTFIKLAKEPKQTSKKAGIGFLAGLGTRIVTAGLGTLGAAGTVTTGVGTVALGGMYGLKLYTDVSRVSSQFGLPKSYSGYVVFAEQVPELTGFAAGSGSVGIAKKGAIKGYAKWYEAKLNRELTGKIVPYDKFSKPSRFFAKDLSVEVTGRPLEGVTFISKATEVPGKGTLEKGGLIFKFAETPEPIDLGGKPPQFVLIKGARVRAIRFGRDINSNLPVTENFAGKIRPVTIQEEFASVIPRQKFVDMIYGGKRTQFGMGEGKVSMFKLTETTGEYPLDVKQVKITGEQFTPKAGKVLKETATTGKAQVFEIDLKPSAGKDIVSAGWGREWMRPQEFIKLPGQKAITQVVKPLLPGKSITVFGKGELGRIQINYFTGAKVRVVKPSFPEGGIIGSAGLQALRGAASLGAPVFFRAMRKGEYNTLMGVKPKRFPSKFNKPKEDKRTFLLGDRKFFGTETQYKRYVRRAFGGYVQPSPSNLIKNLEEFSLGVKRIKAKKLSDLIKARQDPANIFKTIGKIEKLLPEYQKKSIVAKTKPYRPFKWMQEKPKPPKGFRYTERKLPGGLVSLQLVKAETKKKKKQRQEQVSVTKQKTSQREEEQRYKQAEESISILKPKQKPFEEFKNLRSGEAMLRDMYGREKTRYRSRLKSFVGIREDTDMATALGSEMAERERLRDIFRSRYANPIALKSAQKSASAFDSATRSSLAQAFRYRQAQVYKQVTKRAKEKTKVSRGVFGFPKLKGKDKLLIGKKTKKSALYQAYAKKRGKWIAIGKPTKEALAFETGQRYITSTLAASFKVKRIGGSEVTMPGISRLNPRVFRLSKSAREKGKVFVQRGGKEQTFVRGARLAALSERRQLQFLKRTKGGKLI